MTNYTGSRNILESIKDNLGDSATASGNLGITLLATLDSAGSGTAFEAVSGNLLVKYSYANGTSRSNTLPLNFSVPSFPFQLGNV
jgi:hypothetical protein